jgi:protein-disulfide isomerase
MRVMASRTGRRAQLRAEREARERAARAAESRKRRIYMLGGAVVVAAVVVGIAIAISSGGGTKKSPGGQAGAAAVAAELAGVPQSGVTLGSTNAPVTITEYADLQCPVCHDWNTGTFDQLVANEVRAGKVKMEFRNLETATGDTQVFKTEAVAALAASKQNKLWNYVELFYRNQGSENSGYVNETFLNTLARSVPGLDVARWSKDRGDASLPGQVASDQTDAAKLGFNATPSFFVKGPKFPAQAIQGDASYSDMQKAIKAVGG